ncbi:MAG TPA: HAD family phosphatase [Verrucomicrobiae bacterium]|nr:HAD family phosphatase [Verrucomicrobiae bacterium]
METAASPLIVVFDLGKVLVDFDYTIAVSRIAGRSALSPVEVEHFFFHSPLLVDYESGRLTRHDFFRQAQQATGFRGTMEEFGDFFADIFTEIPPMIELQGDLRRRKIPTYIFSNTNDLAVEHIRRNFPFFGNFDGYIYSYEVGAMKPEAKIYESLERIAGRHGAEIVYLDDRPENIAGGAARGWRAILHETPEKTRGTLENLKLL